ncbi:MAG TPA: vWA domain-containing protein, partial [Candidatus Limnocylindrales bacterium]|nr:vWA domain-containing protein [Candidatus Limnocylindrales bacterium]
MTSRRRTLGRLGAAAAALGLLVAAAPAWAVDDASIDHSEFSGDTLKLLVSVPGDVEIDYKSVTVNVSGSPVDASAEPATNSTEIQRTTVLAIDTSNSMAGDRISEAKKAALTYLDTVPDNVRIGIVTFDNDVQVRQEPSLDRDASKQVIDDLALHQNTALYDGVAKAIDATGAGDGQRQVLVLSDGKDNTKASLDPVIEKIKKSKVNVDV